MAGGHRTTARLTRFLRRTRCDDSCAAPSLMFAISAGYPDNPGVRDAGLRYSAGQSAPWSKTARICSRRARTFWSPGMATEMREYLRAADRMSRICAQCPGRTRAADDSCGGTPVPTGLMSCLKSTSRSGMRPLRVRKRRWCLDGSGATDRFFWVEPGVSLLEWRGYLLSGDYPCAARARPPGHFLRTGRL